MTDLTLKLKELGYKQPHNKSYFCKLYKEIPIKIYTNINETLIDCLSVGDDEPSYSKENAELKELEQYMEGNV